MMRHNYNLKGGNRAGCGFDQVTIGTSFRDAVGSPRGVHEAVRMRRLCRRRVDTEFDGRSGRMPAFNPMAKKNSASRNRCDRITEQSQLDHRLNADKHARIIGMAAPLLGKTDLPVETEYDMGVITQLPDRRLEVTPDGIVMHLEREDTACLAPQLCCSTTAGNAAASCC